MCPLTCEVHKIGVGICKDLESREGGMKSRLDSW